MDGERLDEKRSAVAGNGGGKALLRQKRRLVSSGGSFIVCMAISTSEKCTTFAKGGVNAKKSPKETHFFRSLLHEKMVTACGNLDTTLLRVEYCSHAR